MLTLTWITGIIFVFLSVMIPFCLLLIFILRKFTWISSKNTKIITIVIMVLASPIILVGVTVTVFGIYFSVIYPSTTIRVNKPVDSEVISAKQIAEYVNNEILRINKFAEYDLAVGEIDMRLDIEHRGKVTVRFYESKNWNIVFADLDTRKGKFHKFSIHTNEANRYGEGTIHPQNWTIDSPDAVRISEELFNDNDNFRYDKIQLITNSYSWKAYSWNVYLIDKQNNICYESKINLYSGEVLSRNVTSIDEKGGECYKFVRWW
jgi:hypothetical protein